MSKNENIRICLPTPGILVFVFHENKMKIHALAQQQNGGITLQRRQKTQEMCRNTNTYCAIHSTKIWKATLKSRTTTTTPCKMLWLIANIITHQISHTQESKRSRAIRPWYCKARMGAICR